jgi:hypothetical protein
LSWEPAWSCSVTRCLRCQVARRWNGPAACRCRAIWKVKSPLPPLRLRPRPQWRRPDLLAGSSGVCAGGPGTSRLGPGSKRKCRRGCRNRRSGHPRSPRPRAGREPARRPPQIRSPGPGGLGGRQLRSSVSWQRGSRRRAVPSRTLAHQERREGRRGCIGRGRPPARPEGGRRGSHRAPAPAAPRERLAALG